MDCGQLYCGVTHATDQGKSLSHATVAHHILEQLPTVPQTLAQKQTHTHTRRMQRQIKQGRQIRALKSQRDNRAMNKPKQTQNKRI